MENKVIKQQIGGSHYKNMAFQPIELISQLKCSFAQGCIIKYVSRYKSKNGKQDIEKCMHFAQLAKALGGNWFCDNATLIIDFCAKNNLSKHQSAIIRHTVNCRWSMVVDECRKIINEEF